MTSAFFKMRLVGTLNAQQAACLRPSPRLRKGFGRQAKPDAAIEANLKELGYGG